MKCTNKKKNLSKRDMRRRKIKRTAILSLILAIAAALGVLGILFLHNQKNLDVVLPFQPSTEVFGMSLEESSQVANGFAADLCVTTEDVALDGVNSINNERAALFNINDKSVMFSRDMFEKSYPASITKIMTAIVALENGNPEDIVTISESALKLEEGSQNIGFRAGDKVSMSELLHCLLIYSGNDAAMAIAEHIGGGDVQKFVDLMNQEAASLGATGTHFVNPHGLHDEEHYTTVYDIYLMLNRAMTYKEFVAITQLDKYTVTYTKADGSQGKLNLEATDLYLTGLEVPPKGVTILGGKTGTTSKAGSCLALMTQNEFGEPYISIVLNAKTKANLYERMDELLNHING